jgi:hypothetical protein
VLPAVAMRPIGGGGPTGRARAGSPAAVAAAAAPASTLARVRTAAEGGERKPSAGGECGQRTADTTV